MNCDFLRPFAPFLSLSFFAFVLLGIDAFASRNTKTVRTAGLWVTVAGLAVSAALLPCPGATDLLFGRQMLIWDGLAYFLSWIGIVTVFFVVLMGESYHEFANKRMSAYYALLLLSVTGIGLLASSNDFLMIFLAIELIGIPSFILAGYLSHHEKSNEAAIKFFLIGAFSSAMLAYGISLLYGLTGATSLTTLYASGAALQAKAPLAMMAFLFIIVSFGFKIALVPFHMWVPDVFEGAPTPIAAYLSVGPKIAGIAIALRVFTLTLASADLGLLTVLAFLAALTMTMANIIGLQQTNVVRLLAYSSIVHMGYVLLGLIAGGKLGLTGVYIYGWAYLFMNLGAFAIVNALAGPLKTTDIAGYAGLFKRAPVLSALLVLFLVSLAGLPPTVGFVAKFYVMAAAFQEKWLWLVVVAGINSVISVGYYFKLLHAMFFKAPVDETPITITPPTRFILTVTAVATILLGVGPQILVDRVNSLVAAVLPPLAADTASETVSETAATPTTPTTVPETSQQ